MEGEFCGLSDLPARFTGTHRGERVHFERGFKIYIK